LRALASRLPVLVEYMAKNRYSTFAKRGRTESVYEIVT